MHQCRERRTRGSGRAWGNKRSQVGDSWNRFSFTGYEEDTETGLLYAKARFYDPDTGLFISQDAWEGDVNNPPSLHKYLYAYQNPTVWVDPDGNAPILYEMKNQLFDWSADVNKAALVQRDKGFLANHAAGTAAEVGGAVINGLGSIVGLLDTYANAEIVRASDRLALIGIDTSDSFIVSEARYSLNQSVESAWMMLEAAGDATVKFGSRDGRAELGAPIIDFSARLIAGDHRAAQQLAGGSTDLGFGTVSVGGPVLKALQTSKKSRGGIEVNGETNTGTKSAEREVVGVPNSNQIGKIKYGSSDLSQDAINYRAANNIDPKYGNVAVFEYVDANGEAQKIVRSTQPGSGKHSERIILEELENNNIPNESVTRVYSELQPCELNGSNCKSLLSNKVPQADVTYSFDYPGSTKDTRALRQEALNQRENAYKLLHNLPE